MSEVNNVLLEIKKLSYSYDGKNDVLKNVNLQVHKGERIAVLGPNGAGKSTLFLNMDGVYSGSGEIFLNGVKIVKKNINNLRKSVGYVFQEPDSQIVGSTVLSEVAFGLVNLKLPRDEIKTRSEKVIEDMGLGRYKDRPPHYLSGGEKKRTCIAGVIAMQPEIILFDEPMASLDPENSAMFEKLLGEFWEEGKTLLVSTHDVDFAYRWADRIIVFYNGGIIADDIPVNIFTSKEILEKAHLQKPVLLSIYEIINEKCTGSMGDYKDAPRNIDRFRDWFGNSFIQD